MKKISQIPKEFAEIQVKTLVFCLTHFQSRIFRMEKRTAEELEPIEDKALIKKHKDNESFSYKRGMNQKVGFSKGEKHTKENNLTLFINFFVENLRLIVTKEKPEKILIYSPKDKSGLLKKKLPNDLAKIIELKVHDFAHLTLAELAIKTSETLALSSEPAVKPNRKKPSQVTLKRKGR